MESQGYMATSQLARSDARLSVGGVNQRGRGETVLPKVLTGRTAVLTPPNVQTSGDSAV